MLLTIPLPLPPPCRRQSLTLVGPDLRPVFLRKGTALIADVERQYEWYAVNGGWSVADLYLASVESACGLLTSHGRGRSDRRESRTPARRTPKRCRCVADLQTSEYPLALRDMREVEFGQHFIPLLFEGSGARIQPQKENLQ